MEGCTTTMEYVGLAHSLFPLIYVTYPSTSAPLAPTAHLEEHEYVRFADIFDISPYHGTPTDELDEAWEELYRCKIYLQISASTYTNQRRLTHNILRWHFWYLEKRSCEDGNTYASLCRRSRLVYRYDGCSSFATLSCESTSVSAAVHNLSDLIRSGMPELPEEVPLS